MIKTFSWFIVLLAMCSVQAVAAVSVNIGTVSLLPNQAGQIVNIQVSGGVQLSGVDFYLTVGDGTTGPIVTPPIVSGSPSTTDVLVGTIWGGTAIYAVNPNLGSGTANWQIFTTSGTVAGSGSIAQVKIDTTGINSGTFPISLTLGGVDSVFYDAAGSIASSGVTLTAGSLVIQTPEADVTRSSTLIPDGGTDTVTGTVISSSTNLTYAVANLGNAALTVANFTQSAATNCTLSFTTQPATSVAAAGSSNLVVSITPTAASWSVALSSVTNDGNENPYNWTISGTASAAPAPEAEVTRGATAITDGGTDTVTGTVISTPTSLTYTITNSGTADLTVAAFTQTAASNCAVTVTTQPTSPVTAAGTTTLCEPQRRHQR